MNKLFQSYALIFLSLLMFAFHQPAWIGWMGYLFAPIGFAIFFKAIIDFNFKKRVIFSFSYFFLAQLIQLSWLSSTKYQGVLILLIYFGLNIIFSIQFSSLFVFATNSKDISIKKIFFIASVWTVFEWSRLFILCGFSFNNIGIAYANNNFSIKLAAIFGLLGMSFYLILLNLFAFKSYLKKSKKLFAVWATLAIFPYFFGYMYEKAYEKKIKDSDKINVCLIQTSLKPEEKNYFPKYKKSFVDVYDQWERIINLINKNSFEKIDLIVLPEVAIPFGANRDVYPLESIKRFFVDKFGETALKYIFEIESGDDTFVSNSFIFKALSKIYNADFIVGLDDYDIENNRSYNAAFYFSNNDIQRYEKQILVPISEYIPFSFLKKIAKDRYNIEGSFSSGEKNKIFSKYKYSVSICYEETFSYFMRKQKLDGAALFVNITNDGWFYNSKLPKQHYYLAKVRAIENGTAIVRSCNTGVTCAIDGLSRVIESINEEDAIDSILVKVPLFSSKTIYTYFGDIFIISVSFFMIILFFLWPKKNNVGK